MKFNKQLFFFAKCRSTAFMVFFAESSTAVTKSRGSEEEGSHNLLKTEATTPAKKPTDLSEFSKVHKSQKGCSNPDSNKVASPKIVNINMKTTLDPITNRQKVNISNISISKHGKKQWRKKNTSSSSGRFSLRLVTTIPLFECMLYVSFQPRLFLDLCLFWHRKPFSNF